MFRYDFVTGRRPSGLCPRLPVSSTLFNPLTGFIAADTGQNVASGAGTTSIARPLDTVKKLLKPLLKELPDIFCKDVPDDLPQLPP